MKKTCVIAVLTVCSLINNSVLAISGMKTEVKVDQESRIVTAGIELEDDNGGTATTGLVVNGNGDIVYAKQGFTDNEGRFGFSYINNDENGEYTITLSAPRKGLTENGSFKMLTKSMKDAIAHATKDSVGIKEIVENYGTYMNLDMTAFNSLSNKDDVYSFMASDENIKLNDIESLVNGFYGAVIIKTLAEGGDSEDYAEFLNNDTYSVLNKDKIPTGQKENLFEELTPEVRAGVLNKVIKKDYKSSAELSEALAFYVLEQSMEKALQWTEINPIMMRYKNAGLLNVDFTDYNKLMGKQNVDLDMMGIEFSDYNAIKTAFNAKVADEIRKENTSSAGRSGGGGGGGAIRSVKTPEPVEKIGQQAGLNIFTDMDDYLWANEAVTYLVGKGIITGVGDGKFAPANGLTREEVSAIIVRTQKIETEGKNSAFADVSPERWSYPYVSAAYESGLMVGVAGDMFAPTSKITRNELAVIMKRLIDLHNAELTENSSVDAYSDEEAIPDWAKESVKYMKTTGLMLANTGNVFSGYEIVSRAYACDILYNVLVAIKYDSEV